MFITPETFGEVIKAAKYSFVEPNAPIIVKLDTLVQLTKMGAKVEGMGSCKSEDYYTTTVSLCGWRFTAVDTVPIELEKSGVLSVERRNEIAYEVLLQKLLKDGKSISNSTMRELGNLAKSTNIPTEELKIFEQDIFSTLLGKVFHCQTKQ